MKNYKHNFRLTVCSLLKSKTLALEIKENINYGPEILDPQRKLKTTNECKRMPIDLKMK